MLNPNLAAKTSYERILNNFQNEAVNRSGVLSRFLRSCIGQVSTWSLRPCLSQSDKQLLIYGREKAKLMAASKTALLLFSSNAKIK